MAACYEHLRQLVDLIHLGRCRHRRRLALQFSLLQPLQIPGQLRAVRGDCSSGVIVKMAFPDGIRHRHDVGRTPIVMKPERPKEDLVLVLVLVVIIFLEMLDDRRLDSGDRPSQPAQLREDDSVNESFELYKNQGRRM